MKFILLLTLLFSFPLYAQVTDSPTESDVVDEKNEDVTNIPEAQKQTEKPKEKDEEKIKVGPYTKDGYNYLYDKEDE